MMPFRFSPIFSDCLNFINNQRQFFIQLSFLFAIENLVFNQLLINSLPETFQGLSSPLTPENIALPDSVLPLILGHLFLNIVLFSASILSIQLISIKKYSLNSLFYFLFQRLGGEILLILLVLFPLFVSGMDMVLVALGRGNAGFIAIASLVISFFIFVRLNLIFIHYLISQDSLKQSLLIIWKKGFNRMPFLTVYSLMAYIFFNVLINQLSFLASGNIAIDFILIWLGSAISLFSYLFSYRFYTKFIQLP